MKFEITKVKGHRTYDLVVQADDGSPAETFTFEYHRPLDPIIAAKMIRSITGKAERDAAPVR